MKIHNIRHGFATNSSSSHSILILPRNRPLPQTEDDQGYGWDNFTLSDLTSKMGYYAAQLRHMPNSTGTRREVDDNLPYVDHQSVWGDEGLQIFDRLTRSSTNSPEVTQFLYQLLSLDRAIVLGGNDNSDGHHLRDLLVNSGALELSRRDSFTVVQDPKGHCVLFNAENGTKYRISYDDQEPTKGTWPELIDIKITNYCAYGCAYCYQGSTPQGKHAPLELLRALAARCNESGVLEVALGGGEPTTHPEFADICQAFCSAGVKVNVTSRNVDYWTTNPDIGVTAVAFSVDTAEQVKDIINRVSPRNKPRPSFQVHFQVVVGAVSNEEILRIMDECQDHRLTLLGYKDTGRGESARGSLPICDSPDPTQWIAGWVKRVEDHREFEEARGKWEARRDLELYGYPSFEASDGSRERRISEWHAKNPYPTVVTRTDVAIDTTLAASCRTQLSKVGVPPITYHTEEGAFSMYIDAVDGRIGPSSYAPKQMIALNINTLWEDFAKVPTL